MVTDIKLLNVQVDALTIRELNMEVKKIISENSKEIIANHNLHSIYLINNFSDLREFWDQAYLTHIDGMPLIWWGKILGYDLKKENRITYLDWVHPLLELANDNNWRIFYLGGKPGVANKASNKLSKLYPNIIFREHSGYFNMETNSYENHQVINEINEFNPNILMVGMGMPRQEKWILNNFDNVSANVVLNSGACFDYIAGEQKIPPRSLGKLGLEWFYRLLNDPKRMSKRYIIEPIYLLPLLYRDLKDKFWL